LYLIATEIRSFV